MDDTHGYVDGGSATDPGWGLSATNVLGLIFLPLLLRAHAADAARGPAGDQRPLIIQLRFVFVGFLQALGLFLVVALLVLPLRDPSTPVDVLVYGMLALGLVAPLGGAWTRRRRLECGDPADLVNGYNTVFFLGVALSESAALLGFVAAFVAGRSWPYLVGLAFSLLGYALIAPTKADLARRDERLTANGCPASLREALYQPRWMLSAHDMPGSPR